MEYQVPVTKKTIVRVTLPEGCTPGQVITVNVPGSSENVQVTVPANASPGSTLQFQVSSNRVPPPVQAVGHQTSLGAAAEIYGNAGVGAAPTPAPRRRSSTGVSRARTRPLIAQRIFDDFVRIFFHLFLVGMFLDLTALTPYHEIILN